MSKRGKVLKKFKQAHALALEATQEALGLTEEDQKWLERKIRKLDGQSDDALNKMNQQVLHDDLPF